MHRRQLLALLILVLGVVPCPAGEADWKFDVVHLKNGRVYKGLLVREAPEEIKFRCVTRKSGAPTTVMFTVFSRAEIDHVDLLGPKDRERLIERLQALDPHGKAEKSKWESLKLEPAPWGKAGKLKALRYESTYFILISDAREEMVRRAALCLEQIYAGYAGLLPPHRKALKPTTVYLCKSTDRYKALLRERGLGNLINPACFLPGRNEVLCGSDLEDVGVELAEINKKYKKAVKAHKKDFANFIQQSQGNLAPGMADKYQNLWKSLAKENAEDNCRALQGTRKLFQTLCHEAFHAYLPNFVYDPGETNVPPWLNEGLAQVFEVAMVEAGEVRVGHFDKEQLLRLQQLQRDHALVTLAKLLPAAGGKFAIVHDSDRYTSDRHYLTSLGLAHYLTFQRKLLGSKALDKYVRDLHRGANHARAFQEMVGQPLPAFEAEFLSYVRGLRSDGSVAKSTE